MPHFVYTYLDGAGQVQVLGASLDIDDTESDRIAERLGDVIGEEVTIHNVPAYTPQPVQAGDVVSGRVANTLPRGTAIARASRTDGVAVKVPSALLRVVNGWVSGSDKADCSGLPIHEETRYRVLFIGAPWDGPPNTAHRR